VNKFWSLTGGDHDERSVKMAMELQTFAKKWVPSRLSDPNIVFSWLPYPAPAAVPLHLLTKNNQRSCFSFLSVPFGRVLVRPPLYSPLTKWVVMRRLLSFSAPSIGPLLCYRLSLLNPHPCPATHYRRRSCFPLVPKIPPSCRD